MRLSSGAKRILVYLEDNETEPTRMVLDMLSSHSLGNTERVNVGLKRRGRYALVAWWLERDWLNPQVLQDWVDTNSSLSAKHKNDFNRMIRSLKGHFWQVSEKKRYTPRQLEKLDDQYQWEKEQHAVERYRSELKHKHEIAQRNVANLVDSISRGEAAKRRKGWPIDRSAYQYALLKSHAKALKDLEDELDEFGVSYDKWM